MTDEPKKEPTTAELFSTARRPLGWMGDDGNDCHEAHADAEHALALLERRMGALIRAADLVLGSGGVGGLTELRAALTDAPPVFTPSVPTELAMLIDAFADEVKTAEEYATRPKGGQQVTPTGDFIRCTPSMLGRLRWWANALMVGRTAVPVFTLEEVDKAMCATGFSMSDEARRDILDRLAAMRR